MNHAAVLAVMVVMMILKDVVAGTQPTTVVRHREPQKQRHSGPILVKLTFNWGMHERYIKLLNFEMEVLNILETNALQAFCGRKIPSEKENCFG